MRAGPLARKIVASDIAQGIDYMYYSPNRAFLCLPSVLKLTLPPFDPQNGHS